MGGRGGQKKDDVGEYRGYVEIMISGKRDRNGEEDCAMYVR
jgi:hypothetical protein